jgi:hypothetical protein
MSNLKAIVALILVLLLFFVAYPLHLVCLCIRSYVTLTCELMISLVKWSNRK